MKVEILGPPDPRNAAYQELIAECEKVLAHVYTLVPGYEVTLILRNATDDPGPDAVLSNGHNLIPALNLIVEYHNRVNAPPVMPIAGRADNRTH